MRSRLLGRQGMKCHLPRFVIRTKNSKREALSAAAAAAAATTVAVECSSSKNNALLIGRSKSILALDELHVDHWYNARISFKKMSKGENVPDVIPKHRVLLRHVHLLSGKVSVFAMFTFGGKTPMLLHGQNNDKNLNYIPVGDKPGHCPYAKDYLNVPVTPPVLNGWLDYTELVQVLYETAPASEKHRVAPEAGVGLGVSHSASELSSLSRLIYTPIVSPEWVVDYIHAMYCVLGFPENINIQRRSQLSRELKQLYESRRNKELAASREAETEEWNGCHFDGSCDLEPRTQQPTPKFSPCHRLSAPDPELRAVSRDQQPTPAPSARQGRPPRTLSLTDRVPIPLLWSRKIVGLENGDEKEAKVDQEDDGGKDKEEGEQDDEIRNEKERDAWEDEDDDEGGKKGGGFDPYRAVISLWQIGEDEVDEDFFPSEDIHRLIALGV